MMHVFQTVNTVTLEGHPRSLILAHQSKAYMGLPIGPILSVTVFQRY